MILVTGASGNTGRALVERLASSGTLVRALVRQAAKGAGLAAMPNVEVVVADFTIPSSLTAALEGITKAYLLTAAHPTQVELHSTFVRAARRAGVKQIVRHSVRGAHEASPVKICRWHAASERELEASGIAWTHVQPVYNMQNLLRLAGSFRQTGVLAAPMNDAAIAMVDAHDVADVAAVALTCDGHHGKTYVVTGPEPLGFADVAAQLSSASGRPVRYVDAPPSQTRSALLNLGMPQWYVDDLLGFYAFYGSGAGSAVSDAARRLTGHPGRRLRDFIARCTSQLS